MQKLDSITFDALVAEQDPFGKDDPIFDLSGVQMVTPAALVQLAAACHWLAQRGREATFVVEDFSVRTYLQRSGFVKVIENVAQVSPHLVAETYQHLQGSNPLLMEVARVENGRALPDLLDQIVWVLRHRLSYKKFDAFDVATAVSEISQNTFDHNSATCGFLAMQVYGRPPNRFLEIGIADFGDGLAETLKRNPKNGGILCDRDAINLAVQLGSSEHDDPTRGTGLYHLFDIAYRHEGAVQIRSGSAKVRYRMDRRQGWFFDVPAMAGVQIALNLHSKSQ